MNNYINIFILKDLLHRHCLDMGILKYNATEKKKKAILDSLTVSVVNESMTLEQVKSCLEDVRNNNVIDVDFFNKGGNLFTNYINPKWENFARELFTQRSVGLGTPNAASGEGELMFLFLSPKIIKPTKGDLKIGNEIIELKGDDVRVMGEIRGSDFRKRTVDLSYQYNLIPNKANSTGVEAVELEKFNHFTYWNKELSKLTFEKQKEFIKEWLKCLDNNDHSGSISRIFSNESLIYNNFISEIVKILYRVTLKTGNFDKFVILGDGTTSKVISKDVKDFDDKIDNGEIVLKSDYFRINQNYNIGWYIS